MARCFLHLRSRPSPVFCGATNFDGAGVQLTAISIDTQKVAVSAAALLFVLILVLISFLVGAVPG